MMGEGRTRNLGRWTAAIGLVVASAAFAPPATAQGTTPTPEEIKAARELFNDAYKDEQEKRFPEALEKFRRVAKVKESASVRYRIASVLASMGKLREARDQYRALAASRPSLPPADQEIADSAAERVAELDKRIPKLTVRLQENPPPDARVTVDGAPVPVGAGPREVELDPGPHVVAATARGSAPSEETVNLPEGGGEVAHTVTFSAEKKPEQPPPPSRSNPMAWVAIGVGGALVLTGGALLLAREGDIDDIKAMCPGNRCPAATRADVTGAQDRAELFAPLGAGLAIVGLAAVGVGVYLLVRPSTASSAPAASSALPRFVATGNGFALKF